MRKPLTLLTLAKRVAPALWDDYQQAIGVRDRKIDPPPHWWPQLAAGAEAYVESRLAERLQLFDTNDLWAAYPYLRFTSSRDLESWKRQTEDWPRKMAGFRRRRDEYESETRDLLRETALGVVSEKSARDLASALGKVVGVLLRAGLVEPGCVVRATPKGGDRRVVDWAELLDAVPDIPANTLTIGGVVFSMVQIEVPAEAAAPALAPNRGHDGITPDRTGTEQANGSPSPPDELRARFDAEKRRRILEKLEHAYDAMTLWARHAMKVDTDMADALWTHRSPEFSRTGGRPRSATALRKARKTG